MLVNLTQIWQNDNGVVYNNSMSKPWFKLNNMRVGWVPVSWQGWVITLAYIFFTIYNFLRIDSLSHSVSDTLINFIPQTLIFTGLFSVFCYFASDKGNIR